MTGRFGHENLASGDSLCYGVGALLAWNFTLDEMIVRPQPNAFGRAVARRRWPVERRPQ
jgi:precorrin-6B methylase 1